jgi:predicted transposase YdaD
VCYVSVFVKSGRKEGRKEGRKKGREEGKKKCGGGVTDRRDRGESYIGQEKETALALSVVR